MVVATALRPGPMLMSVATASHWRSEYVAGVEIALDQTKRARVWARATCKYAIKRGAGRITVLTMRDTARLRGSATQLWLVVKVNLGEDLDGDDRRDHEVDHTTERRPPLRVGHELSAVLPEVLQAVAGEADDKQPRCAGDRCGGDDDESAGDAGFDSDDLSDRDCTGDCSCGHQERDSQRAQKGCRCAREWMGRDQQNPRSKESNT
jgi:hypothetical protein